MHQSDPIEILFVGNSFTHGHVAPAQFYNCESVTDLNGTNYGGVPGIFKKLTDDAGFRFNVTIEALCGMTLEGHCERKLDLIGSCRWDMVVLQELSLGPLPSNRGGDPERYFAGVKSLVELVRNVNPDVQIFLYETWASPASVCNEGYLGGLHEMQDDLTESIVAVSDALNLSGVVKVGTAFIRAVDQGLAAPAAAGTISLWAEDSRHASACGSYLAAAVFHAQFTGMPFQSENVGEALGLDPSVVKRLNRVACEVANLPHPISKR